MCNIGDVSGVAQKKEECKKAGSVMGGIHYKEGVWCGGGVVWEGSVQSKIYQNCWQLTLLTVTKCA